jgi:hypothetical protein
MQRIEAPLAFAKSSGAEHIEQLKAVGIGGFHPLRRVLSFHTHPSSGDIITYEPFSAFCE